MQTLTRRMAGSGFRQIIMGTPLCLLLLVLLVYPVGQLLFQSVLDENGAFSLDNYARLFHTTVYVDVLLITLKRSEEHTSELQSLMRISYAVFCLKKKKI